MWLITTDGFYSIVAKAPGDILTVRARASADLERLREHHLPGLGATITGAGTDYPHRATVGRAELAAALARMAEEIDYPNFKDAVARCSGRHRASVLAAVWRTLLRLEEPGQ